MVRGVKGCNQLSLALAEPDAPENGKKVTLSWTRPPPPSPSSCRSKSYVEPSTSLNTGSIVKPSESSAVKVSLSKSFSVSLCFSGSLQGQSTATHKTSLLSTVTLLLMQDLNIVQTGLTCESAKF
jgi:hypothetical protein